MGTSQNPYSISDKSIILQYAIDNGIIDMNSLEEQVKMMEEQKLLNQHAHKIWQGKDGKWRTYLPDASKTNGRRLIKKTSPEAITAAIVAYYKKEDNEPEIITFKMMYERWRKYKDNLVSNNTIAKYNSNYIRYFEGTEFENMDIKSITQEDVEIFICKKTKDNGFCKSATKTLFEYIDNVFQSAVRNHILNDSPVKALQAKQFYRYCTNKKRPMDKTIFEKEEKAKLYEQLKSDHKNNPNYIPSYAIEFALLTGCRVGEISALRWDCIKEKTILIHQSEKRDKITKEYFIDQTKNGESRVFPLTGALKELLNKIKKVEIEYGYICEWVFANENGRIHSPVISSCLKNKCKQIGIPAKGIHACRRTFNSVMKCGGVSSQTAAALLGHSPQVNDRYYSFDIENIEEKEKIVSAAQQTQLSVG